MAIKRRRIILTDTSAHDLGLGASYGIIHRIDVLSNTDTSTSLGVVDDLGDTVATIASADYTTRTKFYVAPLETDVYDTGGDPAANTEGNSVGVVAKSPLTLTAAGIDATEYLTVDVYVEV